MRFLCIGLLLSQVAFAFPISEELKESEINKISVLSKSESVARVEEWVMALREMGKLKYTFISFTDAPPLISPQNFRVLLTPSPKLFITFDKSEGEDWKEGKFISWNSSRGRFDFGVINKEAANEVVLAKVNPKGCLQCHRGGGPVFSQMPYHNTTGASNLSSMLMSGAILEKLAEENRRKYDESFIYLKNKEVWKQSSKGELNEAHHQKLAGLDWNRLALFQNGASQDIYENVRNASLLTQTFALLQRLQAQDEITFSEEFTRRILVANLSDNIENAFDWSGFLTESIKTYDYAAKVEIEAFSKSSIRKGFSPIFSKENVLEAIGATEKNLSLYPIDAIVNVGNYLSKNRTHGIDDAYLSQRPEVWVEVPFKGELGVNHPSIALQLIYDWTPEQVQWLKKKIKGDPHLITILNSTLFKNLFTDFGGHSFPKGSVIYKRLSEIADVKEPLMNGGNRVDPPKQVVKEVGSGQFCMNCHNDPVKNFKNNRGKSIAMPFIPSDRNQWKTHLEDEKTKVAALYWLKAIPARLESEDSAEVCPPPLHGREYVDFKKSKDWEVWQTLIKDLKEWQKIYK